MALPTKLKPEIESLLGDTILDTQQLIGGDIADAFSLYTTNGRCYFLKHGQHLPSDMFSAEAQGLRAIASTNTVRTPEVIAATEEFLLLEFIETRAPGVDYWIKLGRQLATMHNHKAERFGFECDNYCGATPQPNTWYADGHLFFAEQRLLYQGKLARDQGLLTTRDFHSIEQFCIRLAELIPHQPASLLHGDLWRGNQMCSSSGQPVLFDPACHYGWGEAELAMTMLFGGFGDDFYTAYQEIRPLESGWQTRSALYNLYHLLNHLNLFGKTYYQQVSAIIRQYR